MRVLVTGGFGFVGRHVVRELDSLGYDLLTPTSRELNLVHTGQGDVDTLGLIEDYLVDHDADAIVHLAATCGGIGINKDNPGKFIYENLQMGINVLEAARIAKIGKVVNLGTVCAYPKFTEIPFREENLWNGYPEETNAPYGIAKKTVMEMGIAYSRQYDMNITNLVPANMAGEYDHFDLYSSHVIPALIRKFENPECAFQMQPCDCDCHAPNSSIMHCIPCCGADGLVRGPKVKAVRLWGTGSASREFMNAKDCARAVAISLEKNTGPEPINLGTGKEITIFELAMLIKKIGDYDVEISWDAAKPDGQPRRCIDASRAKEILGWEAVIPLEQTIQETINWYRNEKKK